VWSSWKCRRVTRSVLAAELYALSAAYDIGFSLRYTLSILLQRTVEMLFCTDAKTLWDSVTSLCTTEERRLSIDIAGLRQAYRCGELRHLGRIANEYTPADAMTKRKPGGYFMQILRNGRIDHPVELMTISGRVSKMSSRGPAVMCETRTIAMGASVKTR
jgi:hypothetical protein